MRLKVSSNLGLLFDLEVDKGRVTYHHIEPTLQNSVLRWVEQGIITWEPVSGELSYDICDSWNTKQVRVKVTDPHYIYVLEAYLAKQFRQFTYEVIGDLADENL